MFPRWNTTSANHDETVIKSLKYLGNRMAAKAARETNVRRVIAVADWTSCLSDPA
jgi:hypothetical protein